MQIVKEEFFRTFEVKKSKFIAHIVPYELYEQTLLRLREEHPKARHFVRAYRYLNEYEQIVEYINDDGEPSGTSAKPALMVLQGEKLINVAVIIVRYFGGIKLGTGGLARAYGSALNSLLEIVPSTPYEKEMQRSILFDYSNVRLVEYECEKFSIVICEKSFDTKVLYLLQGTKEKIEKLLFSLERKVEVS